MVEQEQQGQRRGKPDNPGTSAVASSEGTTLGRGGARMVGKRWVFTLNNPVGHGGLPVGDVGVLELPESASYLCYQLEKGVEGTRHYQGFIIWQSTSGLRKCKEWLPLAHWEISKGSFEQCYKYCTKEETRVSGPWELGDKPVGQGSRTDLQSLAHQVIEEGSLSGLIESDPASIVKYGKGLQLLLSYVKPKRRPNLFRLLLIGPTGIGKTRIFWDLFPDLYVPMYGNCGLWFDGYANEKVVLIDEYKGQVPLQRFLTMLDEYPVRVDTKHGLVAFNPDLIIVTANSPPTDWYEDKDNKRQQEIGALRRRFSHGDSADEHGFYIDFGYDPKATSHGDLFNRVVSVLLEKPFIKPLLSESIIESYNRRLGIPLHSPTPAPQRKRKLVIEDDDTPVYDLVDLDEEEKSK